MPKDVIFVCLEVLWWYLPAGMMKYRNHRGITLPSFDTDSPAASMYNSLQMFGVIVKLLNYTLSSAG
jgi:hypothetical protein